MDIDYSKSMTQKKIKMKTKDYKSNDKDIKETEKEVDDKLSELFVKTKFKLLR